MNRAMLRQVGGVIRLEWKKTFLSRRGWWVYLLALGPVGLTLLHTLVMMRVQASGRPGHGMFQDCLLYTSPSPRD